MIKFVSPCARWLAMTVFAFLGFAPDARAQAVDEAALRLSFMLLREVSCGVADPMFTIAAVPAEDSSETLDPQVVASIEGVILDAVRREALECVRVTEVARAFDTLAYVQNLGRWAELGAEQRARVTTELSNADATITILLSLEGDSYTATLTLVELASGRTLATVRANIPETLTAIRCGSSAAAETRGLDTLAASLSERLPGDSVLHIAPATYQNSLDPLDYGRYIADQFIAALSQLEGNVITGTALSVRHLDDAVEVDLGPHDHAVTLRYWPCDDLSAVRLNVMASSGQGSVVTLSQDLSLAALPAGLNVIPAIAEDTLGAMTPASAGSNTVAPDIGFISVEPRLMRVGQLVAISAEPPANCNPFFFDVSASGRLTPIPLHIFDTTEIQPGLLRYDNNASSQYGIIVQPEDELGLHRLGFICQPSGLSQEGIGDVLRQLRRDHVDSTAGVITVENWNVVFNTMTYEILR